jgi:hypothetical protein
MRFGDLKTGDVMTLAGVKAVVLAITHPHPLNPTFSLIVWWILTDHRLSFDMLYPNVELIPGSEVHQDGLVSWKQAIVEASQT